MVSACLLGEKCKYSGGSNVNPAVTDFMDRIRGKVEVIAVCPEVMGGLPTPRPPAEIQGKRVMGNDGSDVTKQFLAGANAVLEIARREHIGLALLKARSPSCGKEMIYDGTFTGRLVPGAGLTAALLKEAGVRVHDENGLEVLEKELHIRLSENY